MTWALFLYYALLILWVPLLWPALRSAGGARVWLLVVATAGALATAHEIRMVFWTREAIRVDIFLLTIALGALYVSAAVVLFVAGARRWASALGLALAVIGAGTAYEWVALGRESARLTANFHARNALLFEARFRDRETYAEVFGPLEGPRRDLPLGHWRAEEGSRLTRLVVNGEGRAWLFYRCGETECAIGPGGGALKPTAADPDRWQAALEPRVGAPWTVDIARSGPDRLTVAAKGAPVPMFKAPPPIAPPAGRRELSFLGRFANLRCTGQHAVIRQLWLWRDGERLHGVGIFVTKVAGRHARFVSPMVMGEGTREGAGWRFRWQREGRPHSALVSIDGEAVGLELTRPRLPVERSVLGPKPVFADEAVGLAPLTSRADWARWFRVVLTGHFTSGDVPAC
ncbi:MAG: hypothetical protein R3229_14170 [Alphaproteobacteria bacterium]|nr:hypothetical protein [Alphaproteobacteria bacterium]